MIFSTLLVVILRFVCCPDFLVTLKNIVGVSITSFSLFQKLFAIKLKVYYKPIENYPQLTQIIIEKTSVVKSKRVAVNLLNSADLKCPLVTGH